MLLSKLMQTIILVFLSCSNFHVMSHADLHLQQVLLLHISWACKDRCWPVSFAISLVKSL